VGLPQYKVCSEHDEVFLDGDGCKQCYEEISTSIIRGLKKIAQRKRDQEYIKRTTINDRISLEA
jgi:hypothetical protein